MASLEDIRSLTQPLKLEVDFYDAMEQQKLSRYKSYERIKSIIEHGLKIPAAEFLTYYLFHRKRPGKEGYRNYQELATKSYVALNDLEDWIDLRNGTPQLIPDSGPAVIGMSEKIGESIGLSVINRIHDLHEADWDRIPTHSGVKGFQTFDYSSTLPISASDGETIVQTETKGTLVVDASEVDANVRTQAAKARAKKDNVATLEHRGGYRYPASVRYATVAAVGMRGVAKCWLLDPPSEQMGDPVSIRIINRLHFLTDLISFITPRSQLASAARTRLWAVATLNNPFELAGVPLIRGNGSAFQLDPFEAVGRHHGFFRDMSHVVDGPVGGVAAQMRNGDMMFLGVREELVRMLIEQDFERITNYKFEPASVRKEVELVFSQARAKKLALPEIPAEGREGAYVRFTGPGVLQYSRGGIVFGVLPIGQALRPRVKK